MKNSTVISLRKTNSSSNLILSNTPLFDSTTLLSRRKDSMAIFVMVNTFEVSIYYFDGLVHLQSDEISVRRYSLLEGFFLGLNSNEVLVRTLPLSPKNLLQSTLGH